MATDNFGAHITGQQNNLMIDKEFENAFSINPGKIDLTQHHKVTTTTKLIKLPPYKMSQAYQTMVTQEIKETLN